MFKFSVIYIYIYIMKILTMFIILIMMFRIFQRRLWFSTDIDFTNYSIGEKVLEKMYHGDKKLILSDAIIKELETLEKNKKIDGGIL